MDNPGDLAREAQARRRAFRTSLAGVGLGAGAMALGFVLGDGASGDAATGPGVLAGVGAVITAVCALLAWMNRPGAPLGITDPAERDRLQAERSVQLVVYPLVGVMFLVVAIRPTGELLAGEGDLGDRLQVMLPVLYAWLTAAIVMGWDGQSLRHRRYLEDELTRVLRARAMTAAFLVLMAGATAALVVNLTWPAYGVFALLGALTLAGATAGMRFAWLDREAGRDA